MKTPHHATVKQSRFRFLLIPLLAMTLACSLVEGSPKPVDTGTEVAPTASPAVQISTEEIPPAATEAPVMEVVKIWTGIGPWVNITNIVIDPLVTDILYAGTDGAGIFKSINGGESWNRVNSGLGNLNIWDIVIDPVTTSTIYAGTENGIFKSMDRGENWSATNTGLTDTHIVCLLINPSTPTILYAATMFHRVFKSTNGGESWSISSTGLSDNTYPTLSIEIDPVTPSILYVGTYSDGIFKSTDGGQNWHAINTGIEAVNKNPVDRLIIDPKTPTTVYAIIRSHGIFKSTDGGQNWIVFDTGLPLNEYSNPILLLDPIMPTTIYIGTVVGELFKSTDGGRNWHLYHAGLSSYPIFALASDPARPSILYVGTYGGGIFTNRVDKVFTPVQMPSLTAAPIPPTAIPAPTEEALPMIAPSAVEASPLPNPQDWRKVMDAFARDAIKDTPLAGMTIAIRRQGDADWIQAYGFSDLGGSIPASPDTVYPIGSLSMQFTAAAVMQLNERGLLDLNTPIRQYLDGLPEQLQSLTLHKLLTHTSRIYDSPFDVQDKFFSQQDFSSDQLLQELVPNLQISSNDVEERFSYGNYILAGLIIEKISGKSYSEYLNQNLFAPARLQHTSYCLPPPARLARGYYLPANAFELLPLNVSAVFAAGGICSTARDMLIWTDALRTGKVVSRKSYQKMITPAQLPDGSSGSYGYGLYVIPDPYGLQIGFLGVEASYVSYLVSYPEKGLTIVLLSNTAKPDNDLLQRIWGNVPILMPE